MFLVWIGLRAAVQASLFDIVDRSAAASHCEGARDRVRRLHDRSIVMCAALTLATSACQVLHGVKFQDKRVHLPHPCLIKEIAANGPSAELTLSKTGWR
jgi:hypothetical protein